MKLHKEGSQKGEGDCWNWQGTPIGHMYCEMALRQSFASLRPYTHICTPTRWTFLGLPFSSRRRGASTRVYKPRIRISTRITVTSATRAYTCDDATQTPSQPHCRVSFYLSLSHLPRISLSLSPIHTLYLDIVHVDIKNLHMNTVLMTALTTFLLASCINNWNEIHFSSFYLLIFIVIFFLSTHISKYSPLNFKKSIKV